MEKWLCYGTLAVAAVMALVFVLDLAIGMPFGGNAFMTGDILGFLASLIVAYLGYNSMKDLK